MNAPRATRAWLAAVAVLAGALLAALLVLALQPDPQRAIGDDGFEEAVRRAEADRAAAQEAAGSFLVLVALGLAVGAPLGLAVAGATFYRRSQARLREGR